MEFLENKFFLLSCTFAFFLIGKTLQKRTGLLLLNPILIAIALLIGMLFFFDISYEKYKEAGDLIDFWLKPSVVALGVPLYLQLKTIKKQWFPILISQLVACVVGVFSVILIAKLLGATPEIIKSLAPKSVTTPIAMEIARAVGGIPSLTAAIVIVVGIFGAIFGIQLLQLGKIRHPMSMGLSMGAASHAVGTSKAMELGQEHGAYASLALTLNGIFTALLSPIILDLMGI